MKGAHAKIKLNLINQSQDVNNIKIVIFQKNVAENFNELVIAWRVIENLGFQGHYPFIYPIEFRVLAGDAFGNFTPLLPASDGQAFDMVRDRSGDVLRLSQTSAVSPTEVEVRNALSQGAISANLFRDGKKIAAKTNIAPGQKAVFEFKPRLYIGAVSQVAEGEVINSAVVQSVNSELNLLGVFSADIVMTGGGRGRSATPLEFHLVNINA